MKTQYTNCVICGVRTINQEFNESHDMSEYCCESCALRFYRETCLPKTSDCEDCNLKENGE